jgi:hypothetical protein
MRFRYCFTLISIVVMSAGCTQERNSAETGAQHGTKPLDIQLIENALGSKGTENNGEYKVSVPQNDLQVTVDGFRIIPPMGTTSWVAFTPMQDGAMVMGDIVLLEDEIGPVQQTIIERGLTVSALHNHFVRDKQKVMFMHIHGMGSPQNLAESVRAVFDKVKLVRTGRNLQLNPAVIESTFETKVIDDILGHPGSMNSGVYKIIIGRPDVELMDHGVKVSTFMGFNTWMAFQGTSEKAAVAGDFAMLEPEVASVIKALVSNGIEVVAVHNHMVTESPRIFFLHFWGVGPVAELAQGLKAGLEQTGTPRAADF